MYHFQCRTCSACYTSNTSSNVNGGNKRDKRVEGGQHQAAEAKMRRIFWCKLLKNEIYVFRFVNSNERDSCQLVDMKHDSLLHRRHQQSQNAVFKFREGLQHPEFSKSWIYQYWLNPPLPNSDTIPISIPILTLITV